MATVTKTFLAGSSNDGFAQDGSTTFTSIGVSSGKITGTKTSAVDGNEYAGTMLQGASQNTYADLGVPADSRIQGLKFLGGTSAVEAGNEDASAAFDMDSTQIAVKTIGSFSAGTYVDISGLNKVSADFVRAKIYITTTHSTGSGTTATVSVSDFDVEITYDPPVHVSGDVAGVISYVNTLVFEKALSGAVSEAIAYANTLTFRKLVSGSVTGSIVYANTLTFQNEIQLSGNVTGSINYANALTNAKRLSGDVAGSIAYANFITNNEPNTHHLSGNVTGSIDFVNTLTFERLLSGAVAGSIAYANAITVANEISGSITGSIAYVNAISVQRSFSGAISGSVIYVNNISFRSAYEPVGQLKSILLGQGLTKSILINNDTRRVMGNTFYLKKGDTAQTIRTRLEDDNGSVNLTGCTVKAQFRTKGATSITLDATATIDPDQTTYEGEVYYTPVSGDFTYLVVGEYQLEWKVTFPNSTTRNFPVSRIPARSYNYLVVYENY